MPSRGAGGRRSHLRACRWRRVTPPTVRDAARLRLPGQARSRNTFRARLAVWFLVGEAPPSMLASPSGSLWGMLVRSWPAGHRRGVARLQLGEWARSRPWPLGLSASGSLHLRGSGRDCRRQQLDMWWRGSLFLEAPLRRHIPRSFGAIGVTMDLLF